MATSGVRFAAFVDLMGFAAGQDSLSQEDAETLARVLAGEWFLQPQLSNAAKTVSVRYSQFHTSFDEVVDDAATELELAVSFSDSGFVASDRSDVVVELSGKMIRACYENRVPVRIGIATGTVGHATFSSSFTSGRLRAQSQFFGTAIARAYSAATDGAKGFRILLHPSAVDIGDYSSPWLFPKLDEEEQTEFSDRELNFLPREIGIGSYWDACRTSLDAMRAGVTAPRALLHYDASVRALDRLEGLLRLHTSIGESEMIIITRHPWPPTKDDAPDK